MKRIIKVFRQMIATPFVVIGVIFEEIGYAIAGDFYD